MPASTVSANVPIRLSIRRRAAIAAVMLTLLAGSTTAAWLKARLAYEPAERASIIEVDGLRFGLNPHWQVAENDTPDPLRQIGPYETFVDPDQPERLLTLAVTRSDAPPVNLVVVLFQALLNDRSSEEGDLSVEPLTPVRLDLIGDLQGFALIGKSVSNDAQAITHHYLAVLFNDADDRRWIIYLEDRSPPGEPLTKSRETANNFIVGQLVSTARPVP
ncbi:MAG: hypothetical protein AAF586_01680 [Planctomycetota bacterium]